MRFFYGLGYGIGNTTARFVVWRMRRHQRSAEIVAMRRLQKQLGSDAYLAEILSEWAQIEDEAERLR
jgi:hypothetical protein